MTEEWWAGIVVSFGPFRGRSLGDLARSAPDHVHWLSSQKMQDRKLAAGVRAAMVSIVAERWYKRPKYVKPDRSAAMASYKAAALPKSITHRT